MNERYIRRGAIVVTFLLLVGVLIRTVTKSDPFEVVTPVAKEGVFVTLSAMSDESVRNSFKSARPGQVFAFKEDAICNHGTWVGSEVSGFLVCTVTVAGFENPIVVLYSLTQGAIQFASLHQQLQEKIRYVEVKWSIDSEELGGGLSAEERSGIFEAIKGRGAESLESSLIFQAVRVPQAAT
jgi:hypothetical protein